MSTSVEINVIFQKLADLTLDMSTDRIIGEVSLVVERLGFAKIDPTTPGYKEDIKKLHYLLSHDISPGVQTFTQYLIDSNQLGVLLNDAGKAFPDYCQTHFSEMKHLTVVTAVAMSLEAQTKIRVMLLRHYSLNTRILFEVSSEVIAGFKLYDNHGMLADYSVHAKMVKLIEKYIRRKMPFHGIK